MDLLASLHATLKTYIDNAVAEAMRAAAPAQVSRTIDQSVAGLVRDAVTTDPEIKIFIMEQTATAMHNDEDNCVSGAVDNYLDSGRLKSRVEELVEEALDSTQKLETFVSDKLEQMSFNISVN